MKKNTRINDTFKSLFNGQTYMVTAVDKKAVTLQLVTNEQDESMDIVDVPADKLETFFQFLGNDTPDPGPKPGEYTLENGVLRHNGERIETGTLNLRKIIAEDKHGIYVAVEALSGGKNELFFIAHSSGFFYKIPATEAMMITPVWGTRDAQVFLFHDEHEVTLSAEEGKEPEKKTAVTEEVIGLQGSRIFMRYQIRDGFCHGLMPALVTEQETEERKTVNVYFISKVPLIEAETADGDSCWLANKEPLNPPAQKWDTSVNGYSIIFDKEEGDVMEAKDLRPVPVKGAVKKLAPMHGDGNNLLVTTTQGIAYTNFPHAARYAYGEDVLDAAAAYPVPLKVDIDGRETTFVLGNEGYDVATVSVVLTRDRGYVTKVTEA